MVRTLSVRTLLARRVRTSLEAGPLADPFLSVSEAVGVRSAEDAESALISQPRQ
jgi:hypothetical protein